MFLFVLCFFLLCLCYSQDYIPFFDFNVYDTVLYNFVYDTIMKFIMDNVCYFVNFLTLSLLVFVLFLILYSFYYMGKFIFNFMSPIVIMLHSRFSDWWFNHGKKAIKAFLDFIYHFFFFMLLPSIIFLILYMIYLILYMIWVWLTGGG